MLLTLFSKFNLSGFGLCGRFDPGQRIFILEFLQPLGFFVCVFFRFVSDYFFFSYLLPSFFLAFSSANFFSVLLMQASGWAAQWAERGVGGLMTSTTHREIWLEIFPNPTVNLNFHIKMPPGLAWMANVSWSSVEFELSRM